MKHLIKLILNLIPRPALQRVAEWIVPVVGLLYVGKGKECPLCGCQRRKFLPYGYVTSRENALCPNCLSLERHRLLWLYLKEKTDFFTAPLKVLHFAPEQPFLKRFRALKNLDYTTADLDSPIADLHLDVTAIDQPSDTYDVVICNHVLEHVNDVNKAFFE